MDDPGVAMSPCDMGGRVYGICELGPTPGGMSGVGAEDAGVPAMPDGVDALDVDGLAHGGVATPGKQNKKIGDVSSATSNDVY